MPGRKPRDLSFHIVQERGSDSDIEVDVTPNPKANASYIWLDNPALLNAEMTRTHGDTLRTHYNEFQMTSHLKQAFSPPPQPSEDGGDTNTNTPDHAPSSPASSEDSTPSTASTTSPAPPPAKRRRRASPSPTPPRPQDRKALTEDEMEVDEMLGVLDAQVRAYPFAVRPLGCEGYSAARLGRLVKRNVRDARSFYQLRSVKMVFLGSLFVLQISLHSLFGINIKNFWSFNSSLMDSYSMVLHEISDNMAPAQQHSPVQQLGTMVLMYTGLYVLQDVVQRVGGGSILAHVMNMAKVNVDLPIADGDGAGTGGW